MPIAHSYSFDPTYGYTLEQLFSVGAPEGPVDFEEFWRDTYEEALRIPLCAERRKVRSPRPDFDLYEVEYNSLDRVRIGGWIAVPKGGKVDSAAVIGHGYGGRETPDFDEPFSNAVLIYPCARGFHRSAHPGVPNSSHRHVLHGLDNRATYSHRGSVVDFWLAASVVLELFPQVANRLYYKGGSFGGGIGALLLPWDPRFKKAYLDIPSFGNHPLRIGLPCVGSGQSIRTRYRRGQTEILEVLAYFDAATAARHIEIPVFVAAATFDPAVPPPGQFAIYNALRGTKELFLRQAAHFELAGNSHDDAAIHARLLRWFA